MWLEASIWLWGPLAGVFAAWTVWRILKAERELQRLRERVVELEAMRDSSRRSVG
jgi:hypothetical protein